MRHITRTWRGIVVSGLSLALLGGVGLPLSARAATNNGCDKACKMMEHRQAMRTVHEKMLAKAKAEDAALEKLVAELKKAPEARKPDLEAAILTKLVAEHHARLGEWESMQARMMQYRKEHPLASNTGMSGNCMMKGEMGKTTTTAQK
jgi:hypothetical protein